MSQLDLFLGNGQLAIGSGQQPQAVQLPTAVCVLPDRLYQAGLSPKLAVVVHTNRRVLVSLTSGGVLRVHRGYESASEEVIAAIARWAKPRMRREDRLVAQRILTSFPVHLHSSPPARPPVRPSADEEKIFTRLFELHDRFNQAHFGNALDRIRIALSSRMRRRLGEFRLSATGEHEIVIGRRHLRRDVWKGVAETLLHEMVHQWQAETGRKLCHGREFKRMWIQMSGAMTASVVD